MQNCITWLHSGPSGGGRVRSDIISILYVRFREGKSTSRLYLHDIVIFGFLYSLAIRGWWKVPVHRHSCLHWSSCKHRINLYASVQGVNPFNLFAWLPAGGWHLAQFSSRDLGSVQPARGHCLLPGNLLWRHWPRDTPTPQDQRRGPRTKVSIFLWHPRHPKRLCQLCTCVRGDTGKPRSHRGCVLSLTFYFTLWTEFYLCSKQRSGSAGKIASCADFVSL